MLSFRIKIDDKEILKKLAKQKAILSVGFWGDIYSDGKSVASVAAFNEYGGGHTPPRPFMRNCVKRNRRKWRNSVQDRLPVILDMKKMAQELGEDMVEDLKYEIYLTNTPPNAPSTVKRKGFNKPLIDTGKMVNSVRMEVK